MRYPLWAFLVIFVLPPFTAHALLAGGASIHPSVTVNPSVLTKAFQPSEGTVRITITALVPNADQRRMERVR